MVRGGRESHFHRRGSRAAGEVETHSSESRPESPCLGILPPVQGSAVALASLLASLPGASLVSMQLEGCGGGSPVAHPNLPAKVSSAKIS